MNFTVAINLVLFALLFVISVGIIRMRNLFAAAMLSGIFSLISAGLYVAMNAVDVAFTEAAVGAGISTVLMVAALALTATDEKEREGRPVLALIICVLTGLALVYGTMDMPNIGDPTSPVHTNPLAVRFMQPSYHELGVPNFVTSILASYRGYDTMGETTVVLTACVAVLLLLRSRRTTDPEEGEA